MTNSKLARLAVPAVCILVSTLAYGSQVLFWYLDPGPLVPRQKYTFNLLVACLWICYARAIVTSPGKVTREWLEDNAPSVDGSRLNRRRYCQKCVVAKPARAHHCKICNTCIPKMDHHCPWTTNCVSYFTFPHFIRFLFYAVASMTYLEGLFWHRSAIIWKRRDMPYTLGPSVAHMCLLFVLFSLNSLTLFMVGITFFRSFYALCTNTTTIESWELERHEQLLRRARALGGYLDGPDGARIRITRQEFPYDIGIFRNIAQGMGTSNPLSWLWPFAMSPRTDGLTFETNGFEEPGSSWPPPDPDRMPRTHRVHEAMETFAHQHENLSNEDEIEAFKMRQEADWRRQSQRSPQRRKVFHKRFDSETYSSVDGDDRDGSHDGSGEEGWQDSGGNRLKDYGVDEDIEFYDEDNVPLAELLRRRKEQGSKR